jgi:hypothetical protein
MRLKVAVYWDVVLVETERRFRDNAFIIRAIARQWRL